MKKNEITTSMGSCHCGNYTATILTDGSMAFVGWSHYDGQRQDGYGQQAKVEAALRDIPAYTLPDWEEYQPDANDPLWMHCIASLAGCEGDPWRVMVLEKIERTFPRLDYGYTWKLAAGDQYRNAFHRC